MSEGETPSRPGSGADLVKRMDRIEARQDSIEQEVRALAATVLRVEQNQTHATELNKLRFDALDTGIKSVSGQLADFMRRIEGIITGEVRLPQNDRLMAEYVAFKSDTESRLDTLDTFATQGRFLGRMVLVLLGGNALALVGAIAVLVTH